MAEPESILKFRIPSANEEEVYLLKDDKGNVIARTRREIEEMQAQQKQTTEKGGKL